MNAELEKLRATLDALYRELDRVEEPDPEVSERLSEALDEVRGKLERKPPEEEESLVERLSEAARHYEESHPTLSGMLGSVIDALSRMGI